MGSKVTTPSTTNWTETELQRFIAWVEKAQVGKINITFSNMDNILEPKIQAGSIIEIAGALYKFDSEEGATGWSGISDSTQAYMKLITSGNDVSAEWTTTEPVWRDDYQGWYESGTDERYILKCYKDSDTVYSTKANYSNIVMDNIGAHKISADFIYSRNYNVTLLTGSSDNNNDLGDLANELDLKLNETTGFALASGAIETTSVMLIVSTVDLIDASVKRYQLTGYDRDSGDTDVLVFDEDSTESCRYRLGILGGD